jgi:hypothetical protein
MKKALVGIVFSMSRRDFWIVSLVLMIISSTSMTATASAAQVIAQGSFSENANSEGAPVSKLDAIGNIKKLNVVQTSDGTLKVIIDFWALPSSNHTVRIRWCAPDQFEDYAGVGICYSTDKDWLNNLVFYSPAKTTKSHQLGLRKSFTGSSKKGANSNQWIYTIKGASLAGKPMGLVEVLMLYSSTRFTEVTTTCRGGYSITCNTRSSNVFDGDEVDVKLTSTSQTSSTNQPYSRQFLTIQDYFDKITGTFSTSTRQFNLACNANARTDGIIEGLRLLMGISSSSSGVSTGQQWFPKQLTPLYASIAKTWVKDSAPYIMYIEIPFISPDGNRNPCGLTAAGIPKLSAIGIDVESTIFLLAGPTGFAVASPSYTKSSIE